MTKLTELIEKWIAPIEQEEFHKDLLALMKEKAVACCCSRSKKEYVPMSVLEEVKE